MNYPNNKRLEGRIFCNRVDEMPIASTRPGCFWIRVVQASQEARGDLEEQAVRFSEGNLAHFLPLTE